MVRVGGMLVQSTGCPGSRHRALNYRVTGHENWAISRVHLLLHGRHAAGPVREIAAGLCWNMLLFQVCPQKGSREMESAYLRREGP